MTSETMIQTQSQSSVAHALEAIGCKIEENIGSAGILFVYGGAYYIASTPDDLSYVCIHFPRFGDLSDFPSHQSADSAIHGQNARIKLARVWVDGDQLHALLLRRGIPGGEPAFVEMTDNVVER